MPSQSVFKRHRETWRDKIKRLILAILWYGPFLGAILGGSWYLKKILPSYIASYFNLEAAKTMALLNEKRVELLKDTLSFPMGLPQYLAAQAAAISSATKASTLEVATNATVSLLSGLLSLICIIAVIYVLLKIVGYYKTRAAEDRIARQVTNRLIPMLEEINNTVLSLKQNNITKLNQDEK